MAEKKSKSLWDAKIIRRALVDAVVKLDPRTMMKNPVMFVVEVGSVVTTLLLFRERQSFAFNLQITLWLWFTCLLYTSLLAAVWGGESTEQVEYLRVFVAQLRKKLEPSPNSPRYIVTDPWVGYRFEPGD